MNLEVKRVIRIMSQQSNQNIDSFNDAINILDVVCQESFTSDVWIPSLKRTTKIKELNTKQQKYLIESAIDFAMAKVSFSKTFYDIVTSNCLEDKETINNFTLADKVSIAFSLRNQISNKIKVVFSENPQIESNVNINDVIEKFKKYEHPPEQETIVFSKNSVVFETTIGLPIFGEELKYDVYLYNNIKRGETDVEDIKKMLGGAFVGETAKYIKELKINDKSLGYSSLHIPQKIQIIEKLPAVLIQNVLEKAVSWKKDIDDIHTFTHSGFTKTIDVDSLLFLTN